MASYEIDGPPLECEDDDNLEKERMKFAKDLASRGDRIVNGNKGHAKKRRITAPRGAVGGKVIHRNK